MFLESLPADDPRDIIISAEDLCGLRPGRRDVKDYSAAPLLMKAITLCIEDVFADSVEPIFFFSMHAPQSGLARSDIDLVVDEPMTQSGEEFIWDDAHSADLLITVEKTRIAVAPHRVETSWLGDISDASLGPLQPIAEQLGWPQDLCERLSPVKRADAGGSTLTVAELLEFNRSALDIAAPRRAQITPAPRREPEHKDLSQTTAPSAT